MTHREIKSTTKIIELYGCTYRQAVVVFRVISGIEGLTSQTQFGKMTQADYIVATEILKAEGYSE